jgi:hypothetical protein
MLAAVFDLNGRAEYVHWHFFEMSYANVFVIVAMLIVFALAILLPFPRGRRIPTVGGESGAGAGGGSAGAGTPPKGGDASPLGGAGAGRS